jgi:hypothetical protein
LLARAALVLGALAGEAAQLLQAAGELVARALERLEVEQPRAAAGAHGDRRRGDVRKGLGDDP